MDVLTFPLDKVVTRARGVSAIKSFGIAPDMAAALKTPPLTAPAVQFACSTKGGQIQFTGTPVQQERVTTVVMLVWIRNHGDPEAVRAEAEAVLGALDARFAGWSPGRPHFGDLVYVSDRDMFKEGPHLVIQVARTCSWNFSASRQT